MSEHFIKNIEIKDFKCFKEFKAEGFGRVNLIGGKNNVGKTAFMEACYVNLHGESLLHFVTSLHAIKFMRENINILENPKINNFKKFVEQTNQIAISTNLNHVHFRIDDNEGVKKYHFEFNKHTIDVNANEFSFEYNYIANINFIDNFGFNNEEIKDAYMLVQQKDKEQYLNYVLHRFDSSIEKFIAGDIPQCRVDGEWLELAELGDGTRHIVSIIISLFSCANGALFIDELDNGIHYTQLDEIWEIILSVSKEQTVQVFATTHSKECIESYARVAKKLEDEDVKYIKLSKLKDNSIYAGVRDYNMLQYVIDDEHEVR